MAVESPTPRRVRRRPLLIALGVVVAVAASLGAYFGIRAAGGAASSPASGAVPGPRQGEALAYDTVRGDIVLFGGERGGSVLDDTWTWSPAGWRQEQPAQSPPAMQAPLLAADPADGTVLLLGDTGSTWSWDGSDWHQAAAAPALPSGLRPMAMAADPATGRPVLVAVSLPAAAACPGGAAGSVPVNCPMLPAQLPQPVTMVWTGHAWQRLAAGPSAGYGPGFLTASPDGGSLLYVGGGGAIPPCGATLGGRAVPNALHCPVAAEPQDLGRVVIERLTAQGWQQVAAAPLGAPAAESATTDRTSHRVLMITSQGLRYWDGQSWGTVAGGPQLVDAALADDVAAQRPILFGDAAHGTAGTERSETWTLTGSIWQLLAASAAFHTAVASPLPAPASPPAGVSPPGTLPCPPPVAGVRPLPEHPICPVPPG